MTSLNSLCDRAQAFVSEIFFLTVYSLIDTQTTYNTY